MSPRTTRLAPLLALLALAAPAQELRSARETPIVRVVREVGPAVVNVSARATKDAGGEPTSLGSGVIVDPGGFIVTNVHVIRSPDAQVRVGLADGRVFDGELQTVDFDNDLALLKIHAPEPLPAAPLAAAGDVLPGETVVVIGNPLGGPTTVTAGIVSATRREIGLPPSGHVRAVIQTDAAINPGNSGGPLLNLDGEVIGITVAVRSDAQGVGYAIPADRVRHSLAHRLLDPVKVGRVRTGLLVEGLEDQRLVRLQAVEPDSPAARAGLRPGDRLLELAGRRIDGETDYALSLLHVPDGRRVQIVVEREGRTLSRDLDIEVVESEKDVVWRRVGLALMDHERYKGAVVAKVNPAGTAAHFPLKPGDLIDEMAGRDVDSAEDVPAILRIIEPGRRVPVHIFRPDPSAGEDRLIAYKVLLQVD